MSHIFKHFPVSRNLRLYLGICVILNPLLNFNQRKFPMLFAFRTKNKSSKGNDGVYTTMQFFNLILRYWIRKIWHLQAVKGQLKYCINFYYFDYYLYDVLRVCKDYIYKIILHDGPYFKIVGYLQRVIF